MECLLIRIRLFGGIQRWEEPWFASGGPIPQGPRAAAGFRIRGGPIENKVPAEEAGTAAGLRLREEVRWRENSG